MNHWHLWQNHADKGNSKTTWTRQSWQTIDGHHQCTTMDSSDTNGGVTTNNAGSSKDNTKKEQTTTETQTVDDTAQTGQQQQQQQQHYQPQQPSAIPGSRQETIVDPPMATSPASPLRRQPLPMPERQQQDEIAQGSEPKEKRTTGQQQPFQRPHDEQPPATRMRINAVKVTTKRGETISATSCEDEQEAETEKMF